jgi:hypothetical protein
VPSPLDTKFAGAHRARGRVDGSKGATQGVPNANCRASIRAATGSVAYGRACRTGRAALAVLGKPFWLGPLRAGLTITFWADHEVIHLLVTGARINAVRSHLSSADLAALAATGGRPAGPRRRLSLPPRSRSSGPSAGAAWCRWTAESS